MCHQDYQHSGGLESGTNRASARRLQAINKSVIRHCWDSWVPPLCSCPDFPGLFPSIPSPSPSTSHHCLSSCSLFASFKRRRFYFTLSELPGCETPLHLLSIHLFLAVLLLFINFPLARVYYCTCLYSSPYIFLAPGSRPTALAAFTDALYSYSSPPPSRTLHRTDSGSHQLAQCPSHPFASGTTNLAPVHSHLTWENLKRISPISLSFPQPHANQPFASTHLSSCPTSLHSDTSEQASNHRAASSP